MVGLKRAGVMMAMLICVACTSAFCVDDSRTFTAGGVVGEALRVKLSSGAVVVAGAGEEAIGVNVFAVTKDELAAVKLAIGGNVVSCTLSGVSTNGNILYGAAAGKVTQTVTGRRFGVALKNGTDGQVIPVLVFREGIGGVTDGGSTTISSGTGTVKMSSSSAANSAVWIPITYNGTTYYVPGWTTNAP